ncbi:MAG: energy transducer TonB [Desulfobacteraceae bacterium]|nr:energy transducer TonB [Desulfobacteraceae bacterium]
MNRLLISALLATGLHLIFFVSIPMLFQEKQKPALTVTKSIIVTMSYKELVPKKKHPPRKQIKKKPVPKIIKTITPKPLQPRQITKIKPEPLQTKMNKPEPTQKISPEPLQKTVIEHKSAEKQAIDKKNLSDIKKFNTIIKPVYKDNPLPQYPIRARKRGYEGIVELMVQVSKKGRVSNLWIFKSSNYKSLDNQAVKNVKKWIFEPGIKNGEPEEMWVKIPVKFELKYN